MKLKMRFIEMEDDVFYHLEDAVNAGLIRPTEITLVRFIEQDGETYVSQQDLIDNGLLRDFIGVELTQGE